MSEGKIEISATPKTDGTGYNVRIIGKMPGGLVVELAQLECETVAEIEALGESVKPMIEEAMAKLDVTGKVDAHIIVSPFE